MKLLGKMVPGPFKRLARTWIDRVAFERKLRRATPVLVFQMGKVGSLSVHTSLCNQYDGVVVHTHLFQPKHRDPQVRRLFRWTFAESRPINVISLTREPVSRNVSAFFQNLQRETGLPDADSRLSLAELKTIFLTKYRHEHALNWFDDHILPNFGIDVFARPFPAEGFCELVRGNVRLLVLRSEISDALKIDAIRKFLGMRELQLHNTNVGDEKNYAATYKAFRREVRLPEEYVERLCASKYFNHFYDERTKAEVRARWCDNEIRA